MDALAKHPSDQASDRGGGVLAHGGGDVHTDQAGQVGRRTPSRSTRATRRATGVECSHGGGGVRTDQAGQVVPGAGAGDEVGDLPLDE
jgi:hypothetical protein